MNASDPSGYVPLSAIRLQIAASTLCDAAYFPFYKPNPDAKHVLIADELVMGRAGRAGWLGMPAGDTVYLSERLPDVLGRDWKKRITSADATIHAQEKGAVIAGRAGHDIAFTLSGVPYKTGPLRNHDGPRRSAPRAPAEFARLMTVACGQEVKTWRKQELVLETYIGPEPFTARFYFSKNRFEIDPPSDPCDLKFTVEGPEPVCLQRIEIRKRRRTRRIASSPAGSSLPIPRTGRSRSSWHRFSQANALRG